MLAVFAWEEVNRSSFDLKQKQSLFEEQAVLMNYFYNLAEQPHALDAGHVDRRFFGYGVFGVVNTVSTAVGREQSVIEAP